MKKLVSLTLCLGLAAMLYVSALAAGTAEIVRAFVYGGTLYNYVSTDAGKPAAGRLETVCGWSWCRAEAQHPDTSGSSSWTARCMWRTCLFPTEHRPMGWDFRVSGACTAGMSSQRAAWQFG